MKTLSPGAMAPKSPPALRMSYSATWTHPCVASPPWTLSARTSRNAKTQSCPKRMTSFPPSTACWSTKRLDFCYEGRHFYGDKASHFTILGSTLAHLGFDFLLG